MSDPDRRLSSLIGLVTGVVFVGAGIVMHQRDATMVEVQGVVVDSTGHRDLEKDVMLFSPVVEFEVNGTKHRAVGKEESSPQENGNAAVVRFDPAALDQTAHVVGTLEGLVPAALFVLGGLGLLTALRRPRDPA